MTDKKLGQWRVIAASVRGKSHEKLQQLCQDAHYWKILPEGVLVVAVADGAGSATMGKVGAIVAAQTAVETIEEEVRTKGEKERSSDAKKLALSSASLPLSSPSSRLTLPLLSNEEDWRAILNNALFAAKTAVVAEAEACEMTARDLATTLIVVVATPELVAAAQVGDGASVVSDRRGNLFAITAPQNGDYINETTFLISPDALSKAQVNVWQGSAANIAVFSDGLQMLALKYPSSAPHQRFFSPLFQFVADVKDETEAKSRLVAFLQSDRVAERTDDDLTLVIGHFSLLIG